MAPQPLGAPRQSTAVALTASRPVRHSPQVGQLIRVLEPSSHCPHHTSGGQLKGQCDPHVASGAVSCTIQPESPQSDGYSIFVGQRAHGKYDMCFNGVMPTSLLSGKDGLWGDHSCELYASNLAKCGGLKAMTPTPPSSKCSTKYTDADFCSFKP